VSLAVATTRGLEALSGSPATAIGLAVLEGRLNGEVAEGAVAGVYADGSLVAQAAVQCVEQGRADGAEPAAASPLLPPSTTWLAFAGRESDDGR
jgi:hypothetical protein